MNAAWIGFGDVELFALGAALVFDSALLLMLLDGNNRRRLIVPLALMIAGAWLLHAGALGLALLRDGDGVLTSSLRRALLLAALGGLLLMPSAVLHGVARATLTGVDYAIAKDWRYGLFYLPLLALGWALGGMSADPAASVDRLVAAWESPYVGWLLAANLIAGGGFLQLRKTLERRWLRQFALAAGCGLLMLAMAQGALFFLVLPRWPAYAPLWRLLLILSPLPLVVLIAYFVLRFNFLQLVLERVLLYGALVAGAVLFHQVFLQELWRSLGDRYRVNFALIEGIVLVALVLLIRPLRRRSAEALRYLLGRRIDQTRRQTRALAQALSAQSHLPDEALLRWFVDRGGQALEVEALAAWLIDRGRLKAAANAGIDLDDGLVLALHTALRARGLSYCRPGSAPSLRLGDALLAAGASAVVRLEHPQVDGLVAVGRGGGDMYQERLNALIIVVEQLAITLDNSRLQAVRLAAERRALQNDKLSALGLVAGSIAHEVKNPLSSIKTIAAVMREELPADSPHREDLALIGSEIERLSATVERLLQFARPARPDERPARLQDAADSVLQVMRHLAAQRGVTLRTHLPPGLPPLAADAASLREILFNLIGNAIEAGGRGATVELCAEPDRGRVRLQVCDDGPGIAAELRGRLFEPFASASPGGTGLGLYIVAQKVRELGGEIDCRSDADGTVFTLRLSPA